MHLFRLLVTAIAATIGGIAIVAIVLGALALIAMIFGGLFTAILE